MMLAGAGLGSSGIARAQGVGPADPLAPPPLGAATEIAAPGAAPVMASPGAGPPVASVPAAQESSDDLTGAIGFGVAIIPNAMLVGTSGAVGIRTWLSDSLAFGPLLSVRYTNATGTDAEWSLRPEAVFLVVPFKSKSTRLEVGGGLGFALSQPPKAAGTMTAVRKRFSASVPIQAGVEHFLARWFSLGIAVRAPLIEIVKDGDYKSFSFSVDSTLLLAQLFFYAD